MNVSFIMSKEFDKRFKELLLDDECLRTIQNQIIENPYAGDVIQGTNGIRKIRVNFPNRGKRGSGRTCYINYLSAGRIYLVTIYGKNVQSDISPKEKIKLCQLVNEFEDELGG